MGVVKSPEPLPEDRHLDNSSKKIMEILFELCKDGFYGKFTINIQNGKIVNGVKVDGKKEREAKTVMYQRESSGTIVECNKIDCLHYSKGWPNGHCTLKDNDVEKCKFYIIE